MITAVKNATHRTLRRMGVDVIRYDAQNSHEAALARLLAVREIDTVLDIGANEGQYATMVRRAGFRGKIISFEPLTQAHAKLKQVASRDPMWTVAPRTALGDREGTLLMHVAQNSVSSSALPMHDAHLRAAPESAYIGSEMVPVSKLDSVAKDLGAGRKLFVKIDVQGFEAQVLNGAERILENVLALELELSLVTTYDGQTLFLPQINSLAKHGFDLWYLIPGFVNKESGRMLQVDGIFCRSDAGLKRRPVQSGN